MDFGEEEDTNNPFIGSSYDAFNDNNIDSYFANTVLQDDPYSKPYAAMTDDDEEEEEEDHNITEYSVLGLPIVSSTAIAKEIDIISTDTINGIVYYIIKLSNNSSLIKRRYSDFQSLRINLVKFFPTKVIPIIPEKHTLKDYISNKNNRNNLIIDFRKRKFNSFLNHLNSDLEIKQSIIFTKFIDPGEEIWLEVLRYAPFTLLPTNVLLSSTRDPTKPNPYYAYLPIPPMLSLKKFDSNLNQEVFKIIELQFLKLKLQLLILERQSKQIISNLKKLTMTRVELGANFNVFSLLDNNILIERIGQAVDLEFINLEVFIKNFIVNFKEPLQDLKNQCSVVLSLLQFRKFKELQLQFLKNIILKKQARAQKLISTENLHLKLDIALKKGAEESPTIAELVRRLELAKLKRNRKIMTNQEEEEELLNNSAILNASSPTKIINARKHTQNNRGIFKIFGGGSRQETTTTQTYIETKDIQLMTSQERLNELTYNNQELLKLQNCFELLLKDDIYLNIEVEKNCQLELNDIKCQLFKIAKDFEKTLLVYCKELNHWPTGGE